MASYIICLSLSDYIIPSKSIHIVGNGRSLLFLWLSSIPLCVYMYTFSSLSMICCFHLLVILDNAAMNIGVCLSFQINVFIIF